jgi:hypothetical protein
MASDTQARGEPGHGLIQAMAATPTLASKRKLLSFALAGCLLALFLPASCDDRDHRSDNPEADWIPRSSTKGFEKGREGAQIDPIILCTAEHTPDRAAMLWRDSETLSGHYLVTREGRVRLPRGEGKSPLAFGRFMVPISWAIPKKGAP